LIAPDVARIVALTALPFVVGWLGERLWYRVKRRAPSR
jgi:hypothetical protein